MARVHLTCAGPDATEWAELRRGAALDRFGVHELEDEPARADLILFVEYADEPFLHGVRRHPLRRRYRERCFCVDERDHTLPFLPGVYASVPRQWYRPDRIRSGGYHVMFQGEHVAYAPLPYHPRYLYSFVGSFYTAEVRSRVGALRHPRGRVENPKEAWKLITPDGDLAERQRHYAALMRESAFVLCPRGLAPATVRLFDAMKSGRAPVVFADDWVPPERSDWDSFALFVSESEVEQVPGLLERHEGQAATRGAAARDAWEAWFGREASFHRTVEWCLSIQAARGLPERVLRATAHRQLLHQPYRYNYYVASKVRLAAGRERVVTGSPRAET